MAHTFSASVQTGFMRDRRWKRGDQVNRWGEPANEILRRLDEMEMPEEVAQALRELCEEFGQQIRDLSE